MARRKNAASEDDVAPAARRGEALECRIPRGDQTIKAARPFDAFETTMWALRHRLGVRGFLP